MHSAASLCSACQKGSQYGKKSLSMTKRTPTAMLSETPCPSEHSDLSFRSTLLSFRAQRGIPQDPHKTKQNPAASRKAWMRGICNSLATRKTTNRPYQLGNDAKQLSYPKRAMPHSIHLHICDSIIILMFEKREEMLRTIFKYT